MDVGAGCTAMSNVSLLVLDQGRTLALQTVAEVSSQPRAIAGHRRREGRDREERAGETQAAGQAEEGTAGKAQIPAE
jgi:hypothetical protein